MSYRGIFDGIIYSILILGIVIGLTITGLDLEFTSYVNISLLDGYKMTNNQPDHLIKPAFEIGDWFESRNIKDWIIGPCASRQLVESLHHKLAVSYAEINRSKIIPPMKIEDVIS